MAPNGGERVSPRSVAEFVYTAAPMRVVFGSGTRLRLGAELSGFDRHRALILTTREQRASGEAIASLLGDAAVGVFSGAEMHTPVAATEAALEVARNSRADSIVAVGGGSTTGLGKAIALRTDLALLVLPTTYAGSEMTPILGETANGRKTTQRTPKVLPRAVIYDVDLTLDLPVPLSVTSGMNAIAHAAEALYAKERDPITALMAGEGIRALAAALPEVAAEPSDRAARATALYGAWLCGICLGTAGMALHHKLCHVLGGSFGLPHAETHAVILPHVLAYNAAAAPEAVERIALALGAAEPETALFDLAARLGAPVSLAALGMAETDIDPAADLAVETPYWNPRPVSRAAIRALLGRAWAGLPPQDVAA